MKIKRLCLALSVVLAGLLPLVAPAHAATAKTIALTFDDGPGQYTSEVLDLLAKYSAKATFFVKGVNVESNPDLTQRMAREGHLLANHTYSHPDLRTLSKSQVISELARTQQVLGGYASGCFRPPFFRTSASIASWASELGLRQVLNTVNTKDWSGVSPTEIYNSVINNARDGSIVVMHAETSGRHDSVEALARILPKLTSMGYQMKVVPRCAKVQNIMALGDSITRGTGEGPDYASYRAYLDQSFRRAAVPSGFNYRWVGSVHGEPYATLDHEGHGSWHVEEIYDNITAWQAQYKPDIILLHIGTNNITAGESSATVNAKVLQLLNRIRANQPKVRVFVAQVVDVRTDAPLAEQQRNSDFSYALHSTTVQAGTGFYAVNMRDIGGQALYDHRHPNKFGYWKMSYRWYESMRGIIPNSSRWTTVSNPYSATTRTICQWNYKTNTRSCTVQRVNGN